jgi:hypothetical protein
MNLSFSGKIEVAGADITGSERVSEFVRVTLRGRKVLQQRI